MNKIHVHKNDHHNVMCSNILSGICGQEESLSTYTNMARRCEEMSTGAHDKIQKHTVDCIRNA